MGEGSDRAYECRKERKPNDVWPVHGQAFNHSGRRGVPKTPARTIGWTETNHICSLPAIAYIIWPWDASHSDIRIVMALDARRSCRLLLMRLRTKLGRS
jgi:hypothetical protein